MPSLSERTWVSPNQLAELIGVHPKTIRRWVTKGSGPEGGTLKVGAQVRLDQEAWLQHFSK